MNPTTCKYGGEKIYLRVDDMWMSSLLVLRGAIVEPRYGYEIEQFLRAFLVIQLIYTLSDPMFRRKLSGSSIHSV